MPRTQTSRRRSPVVVPRTLVTNGVVQKSITTNDASDQGEDLDCEESVTCPYTVSSIRQIIQSPNARKVIESLRSSCQPSGSEDGAPKFKVRLVKSHSPVGDDSQTYLMNLPKARQIPKIITPLELQSRASTSGASEQHSAVAASSSDHSYSSSEKESKDTMPRIVASPKRKANIAHDVLADFMESAKQPTQRPEVKAQGVRAGYSQLLDDMQKQAASNVIPQAKERPRHPRKSNIAKYFSRAPPRMPFSSATPTTSNIAPRKDTMKFSGELYKGMTSKRASKVALGDFSKGSALSPFLHFPPNERVMPIFNPTSDAEFDTIFPLGPGWPTFDAIFACPEEHGYIERYQKPSIGKDTGISWQDATQLVAQHKWELSPSLEACMGIGYVTPQYFPLPKKRKANSDSKTDDIRPPSSPTDGSNERDLEKWLDACAAASQHPVKFHLVTSAEPGNVSSHLAPDLTQSVANTCQLLANQDSTGQTAWIAAVISEDSSSVQKPEPSATVLPSIHNVLDPSHYPIGLQPVTVHYTQSALPQLHYMAGYSIQTTSAVPCHQVVISRKMLT